MRSDQASPAAPAGTAEELLPRPHGPSRLGLMPQGPVGLPAPCTEREHLAVSVHWTSAEIFVDDPRTLASLRDRRHNQRLADTGVSARVDAVDRRAISLASADVP